MSDNVGFVELLRVAVVWLQSSGGGSDDRRGELRGEASMTDGGGGRTRDVAFLGLL